MVENSQKRFSDLVVFGDPSSVLLSALKIIGNDMHTLLSKHKDPKDQITSKERCVLASLTCRDFLLELGIEAEVSPCSLRISAIDKSGKPFRHLFLGDPESPDAKDPLPGHMVVLADGFLVDTTIYQAIRPEWKMVPPMIAIPIQRLPTEVDGMSPLASFSGEEEGNNIFAVWLDRPELDWEDAPDAAASLREAVVQELISRSKA